MTTDLDMILLIVFGTLAGIFGLLFLMAALEPPKVAGRSVAGTTEVSSRPSRAR